MKRTYLALALLLVGLVVFFVSRRDDAPEISVGRAFGLARGGEIVQIRERSDQRRLLLKTRGGEEYEIQWIDDDVERNRFVNDLVRASDKGVILSSGSEGAGYRYARGLMSVFWLLYLLVPVTMVDLVLMVRRSGRGWESADVLWMVAIILVAPLGSLAWLIAGRRVRNREHRRRGPPLPPASSTPWRDNPSLVEE